MRAPRILFLIACPAILFTGCGGDDDEGAPIAPEVTELAAFSGTWTATEWVFTPLTGGDGVDQMPHSFVMTVNPGGTCVVDQHFPQDDGPRHLVGSVTIVSVGTVWIVAAEAGGDDEHFYGTYTFSNGGNTLTMVSDDDWWFDFDNDGDEEAARLRIVLAKS